jgi:hypothetical protein
LRKTTGRQQNIDVNAAAFSAPFGGGLTPFLASVADIESGLARDIGYYNWLRLYSKVRGDGARGRIGSRCSTARHRAAGLKCIFRSAAIPRRFTCTAKACLHLCALVRRARWRGPNPRLSGEPDSRSRHSKLLRRKMILEKKKSTNSYI